MEDQKRIKPLSLMALIDRLCAESSRRDLFRMLRFKETRLQLLEQLRSFDLEAHAEPVAQPALPPCFSLSPGEEPCEPECDEPAPLRRRRLKREQRYKQRVERRALRLQEIQCLRSKLSSKVIESLSGRPFGQQIWRLCCDSVGRKLLWKIATDRENLLLLFELWKFRMQQLRPKVTLLLLALSLVPLIVTGLVSVQRASDRGKHAEHERQRQAAEFAAGAVNKTVEELRHEVMTYARRFPIEHADFAALSKSAELSGHPVTQMMLSDGTSWHEGESLLDLKPYYNAIFFADAAGEIFYFYPYRPVRGRVHFVDSKPLLASKRDQVFLSRLDIKDDREALFVTVPLRTFDQPDQIEGYFGAMIMPSNLDAALRSTLEIAAPAEGSGLLLLNPQEKPVAQCGFAQNENLLPCVLSGHSESEQLASGVSELFQEEGDSILIARAPVGDTGFSVVMVTPSSAAYYEVHALIWMLCIAVMLCLVILVLIAAPVADTVVKPIQDLEQAIRQIRDNNYRDTLSVNSVDELGRLADNFNAMVESLNQRDQSSAKEAQSMQASMEMSQVASERLRIENENFKVLAHGLGVGMRSKLHHVLSYSQFIADAVGGQVKDEDGHDLLAMIEDETAEMGHLGDDVLEYIEYRRTPIKLEEVEIEPLLKAVRARVLARRSEAAQRAKERGLEPYPVGEVELPEGLPKLMTDERKLSLIFEKLIENGLKFNRNAHPKVTITFEEELDYIFTVSDNGIGIDPDERRSIFSLFKRLDGSFSGNGISLNLVQELVRMLEGQIDVESNASGGTNFLVMLNGAM